MDRNMDKKSVYQMRAELVRSDVSFLGTARGIEDYVRKTAARGLAVYELVMEDDGSVQTVFGVSKEDAALNAHHGAAIRRILDAAEILKEANE